MKSGTPQFCDTIKFQQLFILVKIRKLCIRHERNVLCTSFLLGHPVFIVEVCFRCLRQGSPHSRWLLGPLQLKPLLGHTHLGLEWGSWSPSFWYCISIKQYKLYYSLISFLICRNLVNRAHIPLLFCCRNFPGFLCPPSDSSFRFPFGLVNAGTWFSLLSLSCRR